MLPLPGSYPEGAGLSLPDSAVEPDPRLTPSWWGGEFSTYPGEGGPPLLSAHRDGGQAAGIFLPAGKCFQLRFAAAARADNLRL